MNIKSYFEADVRTTLVYTALAIVMGYISFTLNSTAYAAIAAIAVLIGATFIMKAAWKIKEDSKWWLGNGVIVYIVLWMITWTIFYNTYSIV